MNDTVILDSNAIIALLDGNKAVARMLENVQQVLVPAIVCGEIDAGAQGDTKRERATREAFAAFLEMEQVAVLPVMRKTGEFYARVFSFLKSAGTPIPTNDIWLAAAVLETGGLLITTDRHLLALPLVRTKAY
jgi:predicted nucleic acid-binding protein